jgi:PHP family Zn ribbon phosphoesterase
MTREEAIKQLKGDITESCATFSNQWEKDEEAISMAISALSAEPCRTADDYENEIADLHNRLDIAEYDKERYKEEITTLEAKNKGKWIGFDTDAEKYDDIMCSNCKKHFTVDAYRWCDIGFTVDDLKFCPNCGADMRGET